MGGGRTLFRDAVVFRQSPNVKENDQNVCPHTCRNVNRISPEYKPKESRLH